MLLGKMNNAAISLAMIEIYICIVRVSAHFLLQSTEHPTMLTLFEPKPASSLAAPNPQ